ncbi:hypothetical protein EDD85DRAFT_798012 [Armillaria nabsnona]|nr:hypothetical protein EDD85DRAFT_798012 [Armillaria nabsnona]
MPTFTSPQYVPNLYHAAYRVPAISAYHTSLEPRQRITFGMRDDRQWRAGGTGVEIVGGKTMGSLVECRCLSSSSSVVFGMYPETYLLCQLTSAQEARRLCSTSTECTRYITHLSFETDVSAHTEEESGRGVQNTTTRREMDLHRSRPTKEFTREYAIQTEQELASSVESRRARGGEGHACGRDIRVCVKGTSRPHVFSYLIGASPDVIYLIVDFVELDGFGLVTGICFLFRSLIDRFFALNDVVIVNTLNVPGLMVEEPCFACKVAKLLFPLFLTLSSPAHLSVDEQACLDDFHASHTVLTRLEDTTILRTRTSKQPVAFKLDDDLNFPPPNPIFLNCTAASSPPIGYWTACAASAMLSSIARPPVPVYRAIRVAHGNMFVLWKESSSRWLAIRPDTRCWVLGTYFFDCMPPPTADPLTDSGIVVFAAWCLVMKADVDEVMQSTMSPHPSVTELGGAGGRLRRCAEDANDTVESLAMLNVIWMHPIYHTSGRCSYSAHMRRDGGNVALLMAPAGSLCGGRWMCAVEVDRPTIRLQHIPSPSISSSAYRNSPLTMRLGFRESALDSSPGYRHTGKREKSVRRGIVWRTCARVYGKGTVCGEGRGRVRAIIGPDGRGRSDAEGAVAVEGGRSI